MHPFNGVILQLEVINVLFYSYQGIAMMNDAKGNDSENWARLSPSIVHRLLRLVLLYLH